MVEGMLDGLVNVYFPNRDYPACRDYNGREKNTCYLNQPITREHLTEANRHSAPGPDQIDNGILCNINESDYEYLVQMMNKAWESGTLPHEWEDTIVTFIPKPRKPIEIENMRPSLEHRVEASY